MQSISETSRISTTCSSKPQSGRMARHGWAILDVLLVVVTLLLNLIIVLPCIQQARDESRKSQCQMNLKLIGRGLHQYHEQHESLPPGFVLSENGPYGGWAWSQKILPQIGASDLAAEFQTRSDEGLAAVQQHAALRQVMSTFRCPTEAASEYVDHVSVASGSVVDGIVTSSVENWSDVFPRSTYFGNAGFLYASNGGIRYNTHGIPTSLWPLTNAGSLGARGKSIASQYCDQRLYGGCFGQNSRVRYLDFTDGTSNALMTGERYAPVTAASHADQVAGHGTWVAVPDCTKAAGLAMTLGDAAVKINIGMPGREPTTGFGSLHREGAMFLLGDGSVRFLSENIDLVAYRRLSIISDSTRQ